MTVPITAEADNLKQILPFSLDEESFYIWITGLHTKDELESLQLLSYTLKTLKQLTMPVSIRSLFLEKISILVFQLSKKMQKTYIKSYFPFSSNDSLKVKLSVSCALGVADNYALICRDTLFEKQELFSLRQKALILVTAIQALADVLFYKAILYEKPDKGFWTLCYLFYLLARKSEVLDLSPDHQDTNFLKIFKQLLVFELSNAQQFNTEEMRAVFKVINNLSEQIDLLPMVPEEKMSSVPCLNLRLDKPPSLTADINISAELPHLLFISNIKLIKQLFELFAHKKNIAYPNKIIALRLIKTLAMNQSRRGERKLADNELFADIGVDKLNKFLLHNENVSKSEEVVSYESKHLSLDAQLKKQNRENLFGFRNEQEASLSLAWRPEDNTVEYIENADIWSAQKKKINEEEPDKNATVLDKSNFGFCIGIKDKKTATKVGEIINLQILPASVVTVVRRIVSTDKYDVVAGVEVLGYDAELLHITDSKNKELATAFILSDIEGLESIVIKADEYHGEEYLYGNRNEKNIRYRVEKTLNSSTSVVKHLKVSLEPNI